MKIESPLLSPMLRDAFARGDQPAMIRDLMSRSDVATATLQSLFRDAQRGILETILMQSLASAEDTYREIYRDHADLMRFVTALHLPVPPAFLTAAKFVLNEEVRRAFEASEIDPSVVKERLAEARRSGITLDKTAVGFVLGHRLNHSMEELFASPRELPLLEQVSALATLAQSLGCRMDIREAQNRCYELRQWVYPEILEHSRRGDHQAQWWAERFRTLAQALSVRVDGE